MSKKLKFRVGGKYLNREGVEVEITKDDGRTIPFYSAGNNLWYTRDGRQLAGVIFGVKNYAEDLVSEVKESSKKATQLKLKVGGVYRNCLGERVGE